VGRRRVGRARAHSNANATSGESQTRKMNHVVSALAEACSDTGECITDSCDDQARRDHGMHGNSHGCQQTRKRKSGATSEQLDMVQTHQRDQKQN